MINTYVHSTATDQYIPPPSTPVQAVTLLNFIREETGSSLGRNADYPDSGISWFSSVPPRKMVGNYLK